LAVGLETLTGEPGDRAIGMKRLAA
jgi:hypothetical protein